MQSESGSVSIPGFYVWEVPGKPISIQLNLDVVDRLQQDVIRGFGAVPRRGAEVGGILVGTLESDGVTLRVEDYELVPIEYKRGPSYLLSAEDMEAFEAALGELRKDSGNTVRPIGYFRSHTRDGIGLGDEDLELISRYFPAPETVVLLIRPFGTKPSVAGFYFKEGDAFQSGPPLLEFPFRRKDLAPDEATPPQAQPERQHNKVPPRQDVSAAEPEWHSEQPASQASKRWPIQNRDIEDADSPEPLDDPEFVPAIQHAKPKPRRGFWAPLSFIFLLLGVVLGFQFGLSMRPRTPGGASDPYNVSLTVKPAGSDLQVTWDPQSVAIRTAQRGVLTIEDGTYSKPTNLGAGELQSGSVVTYRPVTNHVRFRLDLFVNDRDSLSETIEWKQ